MLLEDHQIFGGQNTWDHDDGEQYILESPVGSPNSSPIIHQDFESNQGMNPMNPNGVLYDIGNGNNYLNTQGGLTNEMINYYNNSFNLNMNNGYNYWIPTNGDVVNVNNMVLPEVKSEDQSKKTNKRKRDESGVNDITTVQLSREELLTISSTDLEARISSITSQRKLTSVELKEIKRQRRLVKNREYAQQSRVKKKIHVQDLEKQVNVLSDENKKLQEENYALQSRINILEEQLRNTGSQYINEMTEPIENDYQTNWYQVMAPPVLFIILFSFGIIFNFNLFSNGKFLSNDNIKSFHPRDILNIKTDPTPTTHTSIPSTLTMKDVDQDLFTNQCINIKKCQCRNNTMIKVKN